MVTFNSEEVEINAPQQKVISFLSDLNNLEQLMPDGVVSEWESTATQCTFKVPQMGKIGFQHNSVTDSSVQLDSISNKPFGFTMNLSVDSLSDESCKVNLGVDADINAFMKMMVEKPLTSFFGSITQNLKKVQF